MPSSWLGRLRSDSNPNKTATAPKSDRSSLFLSKFRSSNPFDTSSKLRVSSPHEQPKTPGGSIRGNGHNRSSSQPIPQTFTPGKSPFTPGIHEQSTPLTDLPDHDANDYFGSATLNQQETNRNVSIENLDPPKDYSTGGKSTIWRCMCCALTASVPGDTKVFRCTTCLTVNDLPKSRTGADIRFNIGEKVVISTDRTRTIIDVCLKKYTESRNVGPISEQAAAASPAPDSAISMSKRLSLQPGMIRASTWTDGTNEDGAATSRSGSNEDTEIDYATILSQLHGVPATAPIRPGMPQRSATTKVNLPTLTTREKRLSSSVLLNSSSLYKPAEITKDVTNKKTSEATKDTTKKIFEPMERYMTQTYGRFDSLNCSFSTIISPNRPGTLSRMQSEGVLRSDSADDKASRRRTMIIPQTVKGVTSTSPCIDWDRVDRWYSIVRHPERDWRARYESSGSQSIITLTPTESNATKLAMSEFRSQLDLQVAREHSQEALLKLTENLLRRPGRYISEPEDLRFVLIILSNRLLDPSKERASEAVVSKSFSSGRSRSNTKKTGAISDISANAGILKRAFGLLANSSEECHRHLVSWFSRLPRKKYQHFFNLVSSFISFRLFRKGRHVKKDTTPSHGHDFIPNLTGNPSQALFEIQAMASAIQNGVLNNTQEGLEHIDDWQLISAAKVMELLFAANNSWIGDASEALDSTFSGQLMSTSDFYNSVLDTQDVVADFRVWEAKKDHFSFCSYPFLLSMAAKARIMNYDVRRQMDMKAREVAFLNIIGGATNEAEFNILVRRDCVVEDSLNRISEAVGALQGDVKKELKVQFAGEEGIDVGGLKKEWFLMLVRDIFDPEQGLFLYDQESKLCYFNPNTFETSDKYYLVGVLLGLAIYNSTILDVPLPTFAFRKLLASMPTASSSHSSSNSKPGTPGSSHRPKMTYTLDDLAEYRPSLASGLQKLLEFDGDVESTYCWSFFVPIESYGKITTHPLIQNGKNKPVTNANREEFVRLYVHFLLDTAVTRQFEPFQRGFYTVCAGNALSLFRPEELSLLIRGSDSATIDVETLRSVAQYENFRSSISPYEIIKSPGREVQVVRWFWEYFRTCPPPKQRRILQFITASDRVPAVGSAGLIIKIVAGGDGTGLEQGEEMRFPVARTCFNQITLWGWKSRQALFEKWDLALEGCEGFGLR